MLPSLLMGVALLCVSVPTEAKPLDYKKYSDKLVKPRVVPTRIFLDGKRVLYKDIKPEHIMIQCEYDERSKRVTEAYFTSKPEKKE